MGHLRAVGSASISSAQEPRAGEHEFEHVYMEGRFKKADWYHQGTRSETFFDPFSALRK